RGWTQFTLHGSAAACTARCVESGQQTSCTANDGCCPAGCNATSDKDCAIKCDTGVKEGAETCDPLSTCPTSCPANGCQLRKLVNGNSCTAECVNDRVQTACANSDGCCPSTCNNTNDSDCAARCGNGVLEAGETCDPVSACTGQQSSCTSDKDTIRTPSGDPAQCIFKCTTMARSCGASDGFCPSGCSPSADVDC